MGDFVIKICISGKTAAHVQEQLNDCAKNFGVEIHETGVAASSKTAATTPKKKKTTAASVSAPTVPEVSAVSVESEAAPVVQEPSSPPRVSPVTEPEAVVVKEVPYEACVDALKAMMEKLGAQKAMPLAKAVLEQFGVKKCQELAPEQRAEFIQAANEATAKKAA